MIKEFTYLDSTLSTSIVMDDAKASAAFLTRVSLSRIYIILM